jgi:hypothetical protein
MLKLLRSLTIIVGGLLVLLAGPTIYAASSSTQAIVQSYGTNEALETGMIVGLIKGHASQVQALTINDDTTMQGVVVAPNTAAISLSSGSSANQVYVATSGSYNVLVSNENGPIGIGDYVSVSSLDGIGMKAEDSEATVLGKATEAFNGNANVISSATIKKTGGGTTTVAIGSILVDIAIANNPAQGHGIGELPGFLQVASSDIADKPVSAPRVYISLLILLLTMVISGSLLYSGTKSSVVSIGRNPLAKRYIIRGLIQVILSGVIIFILGLFAVYLLLRL